MTNFYVPIEIKNREFYSRLLLSLEACKKYGWNIFFGFRWLFFNILLFLTDLRIRGHSVQNYVIEHDFTFFSSF